jgi:hypothetical protein
MEQYLTTIELSARIKMTPGTIRNLVWKKILKKNIHYVKPTPRKLLFLWSRIEDWLFNRSDCLPNGIPEKDPNEGRIKI